MSSKKSVNETIIINSILAKKMVDESYGKIDNICEREHEFTKLYNWFNKYIMDLKNS